MRTDNFLAFLGREASGMMPVGVITRSKISCAYFIVMKKNQSIIFSATLIADFNKKTS